MGCVVTSVAGKLRQGDEFIQDLINIHPGKEEKKEESLQKYSM